MSKRKLSTTGIVACLLIAAGCGALWPVTPSDKAIRARVVKIVGERGQCSGEQVEAPSGISYILTAGHCKLLNTAEGFKIITEEGNTIQRKLVAEDLSSDLLLLEGIPGVKGLPVAGKSHKTQHVRTFTHGGGMDTYRTDGELMGEITFDIPIESATCEGDKYKKIDGQVFDFGSMTMIQQQCMLHLTETFSTAAIVPGSSGGMVVNDSGELVGVVSVGGSGFSGFVRTIDINAFLSGY